jgi:hypothetical protein
VPEAVCVKLMLAGARERCENDDVLLEHIGVLLDDLYHAYQVGNSGNQ